MTRMKHVTATIITRSEIVYNGLWSILHKNPDMSVSFVIVNRAEPIHRAVSSGEIQLVFVDSHSMTAEEIAAVREACGEERVRIILVQTSLAPGDFSKMFDAVISLYDSRKSIVATVRGLYSDDNGQDRQNELTAREKEIVIGVVKGLSNKEIATEMNISTHTVMTHRRNIASKLEIHSPAGLTIYALARKLVTLEEVSKS